MPKDKDSIVEGKRLSVKSDTIPTIFDFVDKGEIVKAINNLITGHTPSEEIRERAVGGGKKAKYVNTYFMTRQISLITGFRWSSECLEEKIYPDKPPYKYLGAKMKVTIWDKQGNQFSHISWGEKPITEGIGHFDQWKAAYSDGIKKCLSYFGIANDVYGGKDLQFLGEEPPEEETVSIEDEEPKVKKPPLSPDRLRFLKYLADNKIALTDAMEILDIDDLDTVTDWKEALSKVKEVSK